MLLPRLDTSRCMSKSRVRRLAGEILAVSPNLEVKISNAGGAIYLRNANKLLT